MAPKKLSPLKSSKHGTISEPLLSSIPSGKDLKKTDSVKLSKRLRQCCSASAPAPAPEMDESTPNKDGNEEKILPAVKERGHKYLIILGTVAFLVYSCLGVACYYAMGSDLEGDNTTSFIDALYFCVVTMTTVGYGDLVPSGVSERLLTCLYVFVGFGIVGLLLGSAADFLVERQEIMLRKAISAYDKNSEYSDFNPAHIMKRVKLKVAIAGTVFLFLFAIGVIVMIEVEGLAFVEAFYLVCATVTTLGYGDVSFQTTGGRLFAVVWIPLSTVTVAQLFLYISELYTEERRQSVVKLILTRKTTSSDLQAADMDHDGTVSASEFVLYKLKEMGKVEDEDVAEILKEFDSLDVDESGTLSDVDLKLGNSRNS